jgi:hypothetical protein
MAKNNIKANKESGKEYNDKNVNAPLFSLRDKVFTSLRKVRRCRSLKLSPTRIGPYEVIEGDGVNITLKLPGNRTLKVHADRLKPFFGDSRTMTVTHRLWTICIILITLRQALALDVTLQKFKKESPCLYCDHIGESQMYNTMENCNIRQPRRSR